MDAWLCKKGVYAFGRFRLDTVRRSLVRDGVPIALTPKLFDALLFLVENAGRVVEKDEIMIAVWPGRFVEEGNITQTIFTVRKALSAAGEDDRLIETVAGRGYRLTCPVRFENQGLPDGTLGVPPAAEGEGEKPGDDACSPEQARAGGSRIPRWVVAAALGSLLLAIAGVGFLAMPRHPPPVSTAVRPNLVVLGGFANLTGEPTLGTVLDSVLDIDLGQSPYITPLPPERVRATLSLMERLPDARLTPGLAREVCARSGGKAVLSGSVGGAGSRYIVALEASDCIAGNVIARVRAEAAKVDDLPRTLDRLSAEMRRALNESLASIHTFDVPIAEATTSSFPALSAFSVGETLRVRGDFTGSLPYFKRAVELDPDFALAWENMGADYAGLREVPETVANYSKAFELRARASEHERLRIVTNYHQRLGRFSVALQSYELWTRTYPRDAAAWWSLANFLTSLTRYSEAIQAGKEALRLDPYDSMSYITLARAEKRSNRFAEAVAVCRQAIADGYGNWDIHGLLYEIAFAQGDWKTMAEAVAMEAGRPTEPWMLDYEAVAAATEGKLKRARDLFEQSLEEARLQGLDASGEVTAFMGDYVDAEAELGDQDEARKLAAYIGGFDQSPFQLAEIGDFSGAQSMVDGLAASNPEVSYYSDIYLPLVRARIALGQGKPQAAIDALKPDLPYAMRDFWAASLLGAAYLDLKQPEEAAAQFQRILDHRGVDGISPLTPLAYLGLARALRIQDKVAESRATFEHLFAFWKNADNDLPVLQQARREYSELGAATKAASK
ncbi:MAG TPA: tetratricopeptide repeat protein [Rhizomicrobium sp.]|jgi:DNA-binding winged helix-turn-helix (wHTH) protein/tetratricopeptide (TPR) repeat protein|nr:tetratricopeptide repeat protein [Rhizomicrobium sp.]